MPTSDSAFGMGVPPCSTARNPVQRGGGTTLRSCSPQTQSCHCLCTASFQGAWGLGVGGGLLGSPDSCPYSIRLFQMNVGPPKKLEELDPETREYWRLLRKHNIWRHNRLSKNRKF